MKKNILLIILFFTFAISYAKEPNYPQWAIQTIADDQYYYGVGMSYKQKKSTEHIIEAERIALRKLSENISFTLKSSSIFSQLETDKQTKDDLTAIIQIRTSNDVQGYEKIEIFETKKEYWVLFRLSKALYKQNENIKQQNAINQAKKFLNIAESAEMSNDIHLAIISYAQAIDNLKAYFNTSNLTLINGMQTDIVPFAYEKLKRLIQNIEVKATLPTYIATQGKKIDSIACYISYNKLPISNINVKANFFDSNLADIIGVSNPNGMSYFNLKKIPSETQNCRIQFAIDLNYIFETSNIDYIIRRWLSQMHINKAESQIVISKANIYITTTEKNNGVDLNNVILKPHFISAIPFWGYNIVENISEADYIINIKADTKSSHNIDNMFFSQLSLFIEIKDNSNNIIYSETMPETRGVNTSSVRSGLNSYYQTIPQIKNRYIHFIKDALQY